MNCCPLIIENKLTTQNQYCSLRTLPVCSAVNHWILILQAHGFQCGFSRFSPFSSSLIGWNISRECDVFSPMSAVSHISIHRNVSLLIHDEASRCVLSLLWFADHVTSAPHFSLQITFCVPNKVLKCVHLLQTRKSSRKQRHVTDTGIQIHHLKKYIDDVA
jgi:hypothetical protein